VALVRTDVLREYVASIIRVKRMSELGTTLTVLFTLMMEKRRVLQHLHGVTSQKAELFIVTAVDTSNLT
jgi:hypothetical protein